jgi:hypothetical protein
MLRVQKYQEIETVVTLCHDDFWLRDDNSLVRECHVNVTLLRVKFGILPSLLIALNLSL